METQKDIIKRNEFGRFIRIYPPKKCMDCHVKIIPKNSQRCKECHLKNFRNNFLIKKYLLTGEKEQILLGSLLGDGCILPSDYIKTARFIEGHSLKQIEYLNWKGKMLSLPSRFYQQTSKKMSRINGKFTKTNEDYTLYFYQTRFLPELWYYRELFYPHGKKVVTLEILEKLNLFGIAVWYMDDGYFNYPSQVGLCTNGFTLEEQKIIQKWFLEKYGIEWRIYKIKSGTYKLLMTKNCKYLI